MYKKYIKKKGKQSGPYYYESVREKSGKIKTIYIGKTPDKEKLAEKLHKLKLEVDSTLSNGKTFVMPVSSKIVKDALALAEMFDVVQTKIPEPSVNLEIPEPGKKDFDFENLLFLFVSLVFISGFFYLEGSITSFATTEVSGVSSFPILVGIVNLVLVLLIYSDMRRVNYHNLTRVKVMASDDNRKATVH